MPAKYQDMEINSREIGPSLSHIPSFRTWRQQQEEADIAEAERREGHPLHSPTPPVELEEFQTEEDEFGRFRIYRQRPTFELSNTPVPDHNDFAESEVPHQGKIASGLHIPATFIAGLSNLVDLFMNATVALLIYWFCSGTGQKSIADVQRLIDNVILNEDFKVDELQGVKLAQELKKLDAFESSLEDQGWKKGSVKISVPCPKNKVSESEAPEFEIEGLLYRDLTAIIKDACQDEATEPFHTTPFEEMWRPSSDAPPIRLYGEAYTSDEMISAYKEVQNIPPIQITPMQRMLLLNWHPTQMAQCLHSLEQHFSGPSTSTSATSQSIFAVNLPPMLHIMLPTFLQYVLPLPCLSFTDQWTTQLPDTFGDWYHEKFGIVPSDATITHCKRELIQALWLLIISTPDFVEAYQHGIFILFADRVIRRVFPRFFAYMADYPEK